jgi:hypothetical protein
MHRANVILFLLMLAGGLSSFFIIPPKEISEDEKRKLATFPNLTWQGYLNGTWADSVDLYINDHFPARDKCVEFADWLKYQKGLHFEDQEKIFVSQNKVKNEQSDFDEEGMPLDTNMNFLDDFEEAYSGSMLILDGSVFPLNGGSPKMARVFAKMVSQYAANLGSNTRVFSCVAPLSSAFIPAEKYKHYNGKNKATLQAIGNSLTNGAIFSDVLGEMNNHVNEKMFFSTDHHWNAKGAYYAYVAFCKSAGFQPVPLENMDRRVKYKFLGSLYQHTRDPSVRNNPDTMEYFIPNVKTSAIRYGKTGYKGSKSQVFCNSCSGGNTYSTFLCGDIPLIKITTGVKNGRKACVIKNSMGNAFTVYLVSHYEEIWVMDFRYSYHNLTDLMVTNEIDDLIFAVGMYAAMSNGTINRIRNLATQKGPPAPKPVKQIPLDTLLPKDILIEPTIEDTLKQ